jgi:hypothetical protein
MSQNKIKFYKNAERNVDSPYNPYVPQYQVLGVEPEQWKGSAVPNNTPLAVPNQDNPRIKNISLRNTISTNVINNTLPNVGNNLDQAWSSLDGEIIDDFEEIDHSKMIDNNDYISSANFEIAEQNGSSTSSHSVPEDSITNTIHNLKSGDYLLLVNDVIICSGDSEYIQKQACDLVFGEHELCEGNPIALEDISIIKKVNIKVGLFLE